jgi:hypothetical protein
MVALSGILGSIDLVDMEKNIAVNNENAVFVHRFKRQCGVES